MTEFWGLIIDDNCIQVIQWSELAKKINTEEPQLHNFPQGWEYAEGKYKICRVTLTWK